MSHPINNLIETAVTTAAGLIVVAATPLLTSEAEAGIPQNEMKLFLLPLIGSVCVAAFMILLNPSPDTMKITVGRAFCALFFGVMVPQVIGMVHPSLLELSLKPAVLVLSGGIIAGLTYVLSKPFTAGMYERAEGVAKRELDRLEKKHFPATQTDTFVMAMSSEKNKKGGKTDED